MATPTHTDLAALLGRDVSQEQGEAVISVVKAMASEYTRGRGFVDGEPNDGIRAVILSASARLISNASGLLYDRTEGPSSVSYRSAFNGWTVAETRALNRYRIRGLG